MPSIADLRAARLKNLATTTPAPAAAPAAPISAEQLAASRAELTTALARIDQALAATNAAPATVNAITKAPAVIASLSNEDAWRAAFAADPDLQKQFGGKVDAYLGTMRHHASGAGRAERDYAKRCGDAPTGAGK